MRINCEVCVSCRALAGNGVRAPRPARASLALGRQGEEVVLHLCTAGNRQGSKYRVRNNLDGVFTKFAGDGKFTIRLKEPKVDLVVKTDPVQARSFLQTLKDCLRGAAGDKLQLSSLAPVKLTQLARPKTSLIITCQKEYPLTTSFPYSLVELTVRSCSLTRVERRMLALPRLRSLDLGHNALTELPAELAGRQLTCLALPHNALHALPPDLFEGTIRNTLRSLNLSNNSLECLPRSVCRLEQLVTLQLHGNQLQRLPCTIWQMRQLRHLDVSHNRLDGLPTSLQRVPLELLDVSHNPLGLTPTPALHCTLTPVLPLRELAARRCLHCRPLYAHFPSLPVSLQTLLRYAFLCSTCGRHAFTASRLVAVLGDDRYRTLASEVRSSGGLTAAFLSVRCSLRCAETV